MENKDFKTVFKYEDKVFDFNYGWGFVHHLTSETENDTTIIYVFVKFPNKLVRYSANGSIIDLTSNKPSLNPTLSFTEYTLEGFSQDRSIDLPEVGEEVMVSFSGVQWQLGEFCDYKDGVFYTKENDRTYLWHHLKRIR